MIEPSLKREIINPKLARPVGEALGFPAIFKHTVAALVVGLSLPVYPGHISGLIVPVIINSLEAIEAAVFWNSRDALSELRKLMPWLIDGDAPATVVLEVLAGRAVTSLHHVVVSSIEFASTSLGLVSVFEVHAKPGIYPLQFNQGDI